MQLEIYNYPDIDAKISAKQIFIRTICRFFPFEALTFIDIGNLVLFKKNLHDALSDTVVLTKKEYNLYKKKMNGTGWSEEEITEAQNLYSTVKEMAVHLKETGIVEANWEKEMIEHFGSGLKPYLAEVKPVFPTP